MTTITTETKSTTGISTALAKAASDDKGSDPKVAANADSIKNDNVEGSSPVPTFKASAEQSVDSVLRRPFQRLHINSTGKRITLFNRSTNKGSCSIVKGGTSTNKTTDPHGRAVARGTTGTIGPTDARGGQTDIMENVHAIPPPGPSDDDPARQKEMVKKQLFVRTFIKNSTAPQHHHNDYDDNTKTEKDAQAKSWHTTNENIASGVETYSEIDQVVDNASQYNNENSTESKIERDSIFRPRSTLLDESDDMDDMWTLKRANPVVSDEDSNGYNSDDTDDDQDSEEVLNDDDEASIDGAMSSLNAVQQMYASPSPSKRQRLQLRMQHRLNDNEPYVLRAAALAVVATSQTLLPAASTSSSSSTLLW